MKNEVATQNEAKSKALQIQNEAALMAESMQDAGVTVTDLEIPKLMLMQSTSGYVGDEQAKFGDIVNTMSIEVLGGFDKPIEIIPLKLFKTIRIYNIDEQPPKFMRAEEYNEHNSKLPYEDNEGGVAIKRVMNMNFYVLLKTELDAGESFPLVVSFKSTGVQAGKQLATQMFKMLSLGRLPYAQSMLLGAVKQKKESNTFAVWTMAKGNPVDETVKIVAGSWLAKLKAATSIKIDDTEEREEERRKPSAEPTIVSNSSPEDGPY